MKKLIEEYGQALVAIVVAIIFSILVFSFAYPMMAKSSKDTTDRAGRSDWSSRTASALPTIKAAVKPLISANSAYIDYGARFNIKNYVTAYDTNGVSLINNVSIYSITTTKLDNNGKTINVTKKATKSTPLTFDTTKPGTYIVKYQVYARETALSKYVIYSYANAKYVVSSNKKSSTETLDTERFRAYASRYQPKKVVFIASLANAPPDTTDVSVAQNDSIQAWMEDDVLYVAQSGGVMASKNCSKLFYSGTVNGWQSKITEIDMSYFIESNITNAYQMFKDCSSLEHIYVYSDWDTTNISTSTEMFKNDFNLQGYQGTTYDDSYTDATRAHLDNGTTQPGYFSVFQIVTKRTNGSATYTGTATNGGAKVEVLNPASGAEVKYGTTRGIYNYTSIPTYTNAGTYVVYFKVTAPKFDDVEGELTIHIEKADSIISTPSAKSLEYNGKAQALINSVTSNHGTIQYKLSTSSTYSSNIPTATNVGTYTVNVKFTPDSNHNSLPVQNVIAKIKKATISYTKEPEANTVTYNGKAQELVTAGKVTNGTLQYSQDQTNWSTNVPTATNAGEYTVYYRTKGNSNYEDTPVEKLVATITKKEVESTVTNGLATYDGNSTDGGAKVTVINPSSGATVKYGKDDENFIYSSIPKYSEVGSYTVYYKVTADNYFSQQGFFTITINPAVSKTMIPTAISGLVYNQKEQKLLTAGTSQDGTFYYSTDYKEDDTAEDNTAAINAATWTTTVPTGKNAGKYNIYWRFAGKDGYSDIDPTLITGEIGKADITINMSSTSGTLTYPNTSISFNVSLSTDEVEYNYVDNVEDEIDRIVTITRNGNNFTLNWVPNSEGKMLEGEAGVLIITNGNENYNFTMNSFKVTTEYGTIKSTSTDGKVTYNGSATNGGAKVTVTEPSTGYTIKYGKTEGTYNFDSIPTYTNAGTHTVYYKISAENYKDKTGKLNIVINKKVAVVTTAPKAKDLTYNGSTQALVTAGTTNNGTLQYSLDNKNWSTTIPTGTNAGTYDVYYKVVGDSNHSDSTPVKLTVTIARGTIIASATNGNATYTGNATSGGAKVTVNDPSSGYTIKYGASSGGYNSATIPTFIDAGTHTVYYQITAPNYSTYNGRFDIIINKATASITKVPTAKTLTYNGSAQALVNAGTGTGGTFKYSTDNTNWSTTIPSKTAAGAYTVYYKVIGDSNHNDSAIGSVKVTINTKAMKVTATNGSTTYTGTATNGGAKVTVTTPTSGYTVKYGTSSGSYTLNAIPTYVNAGSYTVYYQVTATNYTTFTGSLTITISTKAINISVTNGTAVYSGSATNGGAKVIVSDPSSGATVRYGTTSGTYNLTTVPTYTNAGTYTIYYQATATNYASKTGSLTITISKADAKVTKVPTAKALTYNGSAQELVTAGVGTGGTLKYSTDGTNWSTSIPTKTAAGTYTVYYKVTGDSNHNDSAVGSVTVTIGTKAITVTTTNGSATYTGSATNGGTKLTVTAPSSGATVKYGTTSGTYNLTSIPTYTNAGTYTIYYQVTATNYTTKTGTLTITINKASAKVTTVPTAKTLAYTGSSQALVTAGAGTGGTFKYSTDNTNWGTSIPTKTAAGTYTVYYKVTGDDNHNDSSVGNVKVTISKADAKVTTVPKANDLSYTGSSQALVTAGAGTGGTFKYSTDNTNWSTSIPTKTAAGTYTVYYKVTGDENHNDSAVGTVSVTIKKEKTYILASGETVNAKLNEIVGNNSGVKLTRITFTDEPIPDGMAPTTYDLSEKQDGSVIAFCTMNLGDETNYSIVITTQTSGQNVIFNKDSSSMFSNLSMNYIDFLSVDTSNVKTFLCMFKSCRSLYEINNLNNFDTSSAENMNSMFYSCYSLRKVDVSTFDTSNVTTFSCMFGYDSYLTELNVSGFDTGSVTNMEAMFDNCSSLIELDLSSFSTNYVTEFSAMFRNCENLKTIYASESWYTYASIRSTNMFSGCENIVGQTGTIYDSSRTDVSMANYIDGYLTNMNMSQRLVTGSVFKQNIPSTATAISFNAALPNPRYSLIDLSAATDYGVVGWLDSDNVFNISTRRPNKKIEFNENSSGMFMSLGLKNIDFDDNSIDTSRVTDMSYMFTNCSSLLLLDLSQFNTVKVADMSNMFSGCSQTNTIYVSALWNTSNVTSSSNMFDKCTNIEGYYSIKYNSSKTDKSMANYTTGYLQEKNNSTPMHIEILFNNSVRDKITRYVPSNLTFEKLIQAGLFGSAGKIHNGTVSTGGSISTNICYLHKKDSAGNNTYVGSSEYPRTDVTYWYDIYIGQ